jgi:hypothetical protein
VANLLEGLVVTITVRALLKSIVGAFAMVFGAAGSSVAGETRSVLTFSNLIARLRRDAALRGRFADNPRAILLENGIDPTPYNLPDRISAAQMDRLLAQFAQAPTSTQQPDPPKPQPRPPSVIYGPPAGPRPSPPPAPPPAPPK